MSMNDRKEPEASSSTDASQAAAAVSLVPEPVVSTEALIEESCI